MKPADTQDHWWQSKRVYASVAAAIALAAGVFGFQVEESRVVEVVTAVGTIAAILLPLWSKKADKRPVHPKKPVA